MSRQFSTVLLLLSFLHVAAHEIVFSPFENGQELNEEQVRNITQLEDGRLVVFTEGMLNLFDGDGFKGIHINAENTRPIKSYKGFHRSYIENNRLWLKNKGELALVNLSTEESIKPTDVLNKLGFSKAPADLFIDSYQDIWLLSESGELICRDNKLNKTFIFLKNIDIAKNEQDLLYDIARIGNRIYLFNQSGLMRCFDRFSGKELYRKHFLQGNKAKFGNTLLVVPMGKYLYQLRNGIKGGQLTRFDTQTQETIVLMETQSWFNCLAAGNGGKFWLSGKEGLWHFEANSKSGKYYPTLQLMDGRKVKNEISTIFCDRQGGVWAGTLNKGLYYYHQNRFKLQSFGKAFFHLPDVAELQVTCFEENTKGKLLIGTRQGLFKASLPLDYRQSFETVLPNISCNALSRDSSGKIWLGTPEGLFLLHENGSTRQYLNDGVNSIYRSKSGPIYFCTANSGLLTTDEKSGTLRTLYPSKQIPGIKQIVGWKEDLIGISSLGIFIISGKDNKIRYPLTANEKKPLMFQHANHQYTCLLSDKDGLLWFGTHDGMNVWDDKEQKLYRIHTEHGMINNTIKAITEAKDGTIWVTTSRGVTQVEKIRGNAGYRFRFVNYNRYDGVIERTFVERSVFVSDRQGLFMGGVDGLNVFPSDGNAIHLNNSLKPVLLDFKLFGKPVQRGHAYNGRVILEKSLASTDTLVIRYDQNFFSLSFSGLNYINPTQTWYRYILKGIDKNWRIEKSPSGVNEAFYTDLAPGQYMFHVQASTDGLNWAGPNTALLIIIEPPVWNTIYARTIYIVLFILLLAVLVRTYHKKAMKRLQIREDIAIEKAKADFLTNISHELRTPLALIITPLKSLLSKVTDASIRTELIRINNNADSLADTINQLLEYKRLDAEHESLNLSYCNNLDFIEELCGAYNMLAAEKRLSFQAKIHHGDIGIWMDKQKVLRIISNLLANALKFTTQGNIKIEVNLPDNETLLIRVEDTGVGISDQELGNIFRRFYKAENQPGLNSGSGLGLYLVKEYATMHGGTASVWSVMQQGTIFEVNLSVKGRNLLPADTMQISQRNTLLIVEDHSAFRNYMVQELSLNYTILTAENGKTGLEKAIEHEPDLIITDMMMPVMTGVQFCIEVRKRISISHIPVIMLTAKTSAESEFAGYESGADAYVVKPFDITLLRLRIKKLLEMTDVRKKTFDKETEVKPAEITNSPLDRDLLERALSFVYKNISDPDYSVEKFSSDLNMDRTGLYRKLMALTGRSPSNFVRTIRLKKAAELLLERKLNVSEIAEQVGFASLSYFTKCFHEEFAKSPSQFITDSKRPVKS